MNDSDKLIRGLCTEENLSPCVSIVLPVYNAEKYLNESIDSILSQSFSDFELIVVDDGSTDESINIVENYKDERIRLVTGEHDYIRSLNSGLSYSKGKYIARTDADDIMLPERLEIQTGFMEEHPDIDICGTWATYFGTNEYECKTYTEHADIVINLLFGNVLINPTVMFRKDSLPKRGILYSYDYPYAEDYKMWTDCVENGLRFANISEILLKYRQSETQITSVHYEKMLQSATKIKLEYAKYVTNLISDDYPDYNLPKKYSVFKDNEIHFKNYTEILAELYGKTINKTLKISDTANKINIKSV